MPASGRVAGSGTAEVPVTWKSKAVTPAKKKDEAGGYVASPLASSSVLIVTSASVVSVLPGKLSHARPVAPQVARCDEVIGACSQAEAGEEVGCSARIKAQSRNGRLRNLVRGGCAGADSIGQVYRSRSVAAKAG